MKFAGDRPYSNAEVAAPRARINRPGMRQISPRSQSTAAG
jgi:hypothetical protein